MSLPAAIPIQQKNTLSLVSDVMVLRAGLQMLAEKTSSDSVFFLLTSEARLKYQRLQTVVYAVSV